MNCFDEMASGKKPNITFQLLRYNVFKEEKKRYICVKNNDKNLLLSIQIV